jgi:uncharacterized Zn-binding protein involved in type VI secretion
MRNVVVDGDPSQGIDCTPVKAHASSKVSINGKNIVVEGDSYDPHCSDNSHTPIAQASVSITINSKRIILQDDSLSCGDKATATSKVGVM